MSPAGANGAAVSRILSLEQTAGEQTVGNVVRARVTEPDVILSAEPVIEAERIVILVLPVRENIEPVDTEIAGVEVVRSGQHQFEVALRQPIDPICRDNVVGELIANHSTTGTGSRGGRIKNVSPKHRVRKVAGQFVGGGNSRALHVRLAIHKALIGEKEERLVLTIVGLGKDDRSAEGAAKLILAECGGLR